MPKHSLWKPSAAMHNSAITPLWQRWNLIWLERLHKCILILISLVTELRGLSAGGVFSAAGRLWFICDSRPLVASSCLKSGVRPAAAAGRLETVCGGIRRRKASEEGVMCRGVTCNTLDMWPSQSCQNQSVVKLRSRQQVCQRRLPDLDLSMSTTCLRVSACLCLVISKQHSLHYFFKGDLKGVF